MHHVQHGLLQLPRILRVERLVAFFGISFEIGVLQGSVYTSVFKQDITQQLRAVRPGQYTANVHGEGIGSCQQAYVSFLLHHRGEVFAGADAFVGRLLHEGGDGGLQLLQLFRTAAVNSQQSAVVVGKQYSCVFYFNAPVTAGLDRGGAQLFLDKQPEHGFKLL